MGINIAQVLRQWAVREPARVALVLGDQARREVSFGELDERARRAAARLCAEGIGPGARVALSVPNGLGFLDGWFGALYAGVTVLPVPPMSAPRELAHRLAHARCAALLCDASTGELAEAALAQLPSVRRLDAARLAECSEAADGPRDVAPETTAMILYTSGTTGTPRGALITHASLAVHTAALVHHVLRLTPGDAVLACLPLTHSYGIRMSLLAPFYAGARSVLVERFAPARVRELCARELVTWFPGVPTMFHALAHDAATRPADFPALRWCLSAGAPLPREVRLRAEAALGCKVRQGFGLTEATFSTVSLPEDAGGEDTVGRPVFGVEVRIVDVSGAPVPVGEAGEICVRGQNVMAGYLDDAEASAQVLRDGWLHSGDIGSLDAEGRLSVVDRIKDLIIRGGFNVYPAEVEAVLVSHPQVRDAVVVGTAHERHGEEVVAVLVLAPGASLDVADLDAFCRAQLNRTKLPRLYAAIAAMPVGASGKVLRRAVRELVQQGGLDLTPTG
jgi:long-chain acyl-CoA synthetase